MFIWPQIWKTLHKRGSGKESHYLLQQHITARTAGRCEQCSHQHLSTIMASEDINSVCKSQACPVHKQERTKVVIA